MRQPARGADDAAVPRTRRILVITALLAIAGVAVPPAHAAYPGRNGLIAFVRPPGNDFTQGDIWTVRPDGGSPRRLTFTGNNTTPAWSPNGQLIAFTSSRSGSDDIWVMRGDGTGVRRVTFAATNESDPSWSPDGRWLAFSSDRLTTDPRNRRSAIYRLRSTRPYGAAIQITHPGPDDVGGFENDLAPSWAPAGTIYLTRQFRWDEDAEPPWASVYSVPAAGGTATDMLPHLSSSAWSQDVSADGRQLAWSSDEGSDGFYDPPMEIMIRDAAGQIRQLTPERLDVTTQDPAWAPDGTRIAYDRVNQTGPGTAVLTIRPDGTGAVLVTRNAVEPNWQPIPR
jgi:TolB protein